MSDREVRGRSSRRCPESGGEGGGPSPPATLGVPVAGAMRLRPERLPWATLIRRVFLAEVLQCPCGGRRRVLSMVFDPVSIERVLRHMGLPWKAPERAPPRALEGWLGFG